MRTEREEVEVGGRRGWHKFKLERMATPETLVPPPASAPEEDERTQLITQYKAKVKEHREVEAK